MNDKDRNVFDDWWGGGRVPFKMSANQQEYPVSMNSNKRGEVLYQWTLKKVTEISLLVIWKGGESVVKIG